MNRGERVQDNTLFGVSFSSMALRFCLYNNLFTLASGRCATCALCALRPTEK